MIELKNEELKEVVGGNLALFILVSSHTAVSRDVRIILLTAPGGPPGGPR